jgi:hypothetical protein
MAHHKIDPGVCEVFIESWVVEGGKAMQLYRWMTAREMNSQMPYYNGAGKEILVAKFIGRSWRNAKVLMLLKEGNMKIASSGHKLLQEVFNAVDSMEKLEPMFKI